MGVGIVGEEVRMMELRAGFTPVPGRTAAGSEGTLRVCTDLVS